MKKWLADNGNLLAWAVALALAWTFVFSAAAAQPFYGDIIRLHILAHDDSHEEQRLKMDIRDEVWGLISGLVADAPTAAHARFIILQNLPEIEQAAAAAAGQAVAVHLAPSLAFPATSYGGISFGAGFYESLQIVVGQGAGANWWCVMFPPMCLMDITRADVVYTGGPYVQARPRFFAVEFLSGLFN